MAPEPRQLPAFVLLLTNPPGVAAAARRAAILGALAAGSALAAAGSAPAGDLYVICHAGVTLQSVEVRDMFLGDKQFSAGVKLQPADNTAAQAHFLDRVMRMDAGKYATAWTKKSFRGGLRPPPEKGTDAEALDFVRRTPGACSYTSSQPGNGVVLVIKL